jgi:gliding motility-associated-like protein
MRRALPQHVPTHALFVFLFSFFAFQQSTYAQMTVTPGNVPPYTPTNLISDVFLGSGVEVKSISHSGFAGSVGYFANAASVIGLERGIVLTTGLVETENNTDVGANGTGNQQAEVDVPSSATSPELLSSLPGAILHDVAVYTIRFTPTSDTLRFRYVFASEEYPEYACTQYNDIFGFYIQGPGYPTFKNIAIIPGTSLPVAINNLHPANPDDALCPPLNVQYFRDNLTTGKQPVYDGFTQVFTAEAIVTPCEEYTIKLAIADVGDGIFDSGVFLEAKSFGTNSLLVEANTVSNDGTVTEGCTAGTLRFSVPNPATDTVNIDYTIFGSATNGTDYQAIPVNLCIKPGQTMVEVPIIALEDGITEPNETIFIDVQRDACNRDTISILVRDNGLIAPSLQNDTVFCTNTGTPIKLTGQSITPTPAPLTFNNTTDFDLSWLFTGTLSPAKSPVTVAGVVQKTVASGVIQSVCLNIDHPSDGDLDIYLVSPDGKFLELSSDNGGTGDNYTNTCFTPNATKSIQLTGSAPPFTGNFKPEGDWSALDGAPTNGIWKLQVSDDGLAFSGKLLDWAITFAPAYAIQYNWTPSAGLSCSDCPEPIALPTASTKYVVKATDNYGCQVTDSIKFDLLSGIAAPTVQCDSVSPNSITFAWDSVAYATGFQISVNNGSWITPNIGNTSHIVTGLPPLTTVSVRVRGVGTLPCPAQIAQATCRNCAAPQAALEKRDLLCFGDQNGWIRLTPDQANPPYTYSTVGGAANPDSLFRNLAAGAYNVRVRDQDGCFTDMNINLTQPAVLVANAAITDPISCFGITDGVVTATKTGGTGMATFAFTNAATVVPSTAGVTSNLGVGVYKVIATDANGCKDSTIVALTQPDSISLTTSAFQAKCFGTPTGRGEALATGGTGALQYSWTSGANTAVVNNLVAGPYTVTVTDASGCTKRQNIIVGQPPAITPVVSATATKCANSTDGSVSVTATGGTGILGYKWSAPTNPTTLQVQNIAGGTYSVTITDANLCTTTAIAIVSSPAAIVPQITTTDALCNGAATGTAVEAATGGTGALQYSWGIPVQSVGGKVLLSAGAYSPTITDANGCTTVANLTIGEPASIVSNTTATNVICYGAANGRITLAPQGGKSPFGYAWSGTSSNGAEVQNLAPGNYTCTITDANGCTSTTSRSITQPDSITKSAQVTHLKCFQDASGKLNATASGGTGAMTLKWSSVSQTVSNTGLASGLSAGRYTLQVQDANNCTAYLTVELKEPPRLESLTPDVADTTCFGATNGSIKLLASGGTTPYTFAVGGQTINGNQVNNLAPAVYGWSVTDANQCKLDSTVRILQKSEMNIWAAAVAPRCYNGNDGTAEITSAFYGSAATPIPTLNYRWSNGASAVGAAITGLSATKTYQVTATDAQGCTAETTVSVPNQPPYASEVIETETARCNGEASGKALVGQKGGKAPHSYLWSANTGGQTTAQAINLLAGTYGVTITDAVGCPVDASITIGQPTKLDETLKSAPVQCFGETNGTAKVAITGGIAPYQFSWSTGAQTDSIQQLSAGIYQVTTTDKNGCTTAGQIEVRGPGAPILAQAMGRDPICYAGDEGQVIFDAPAGGTPPYLYSINQKQYNGARTQLGLSAGIYQPSVRDANGCVFMLPPVTLQERNQMTVDLGPDFSITLGQDTALMAVVTNGVGKLTYIWAREDSILLTCTDCPNPGVLGLQYQNTFDLYIVDSTGCFAEDFITIQVEKPRRVYVPTGFTPDGDMNNDKLMVHGQLGVQLLEFCVFDRWGEKVFTQANGMINDRDFSWDGVYRGSEMDPGVYVWTLKVRYTDGVEETLSGSSTLIR